MTTKDFRGKKIVIMGLGLNDGGAGTARFFARVGAQVLVTDLKTKKELASSIAKLKKFKNISYVLGKHRDRDFRTADLVIQGPGVPDHSPYLGIARKAGVQIDTDIGIFFELTPAPVIGVTGSKGKSTTASLILRMIRGKFRSAELAGNIGRSVFDTLARARASVPVVLELSSWQLEGLSHHKKSPHISVITNILREHLNRYKNFDEYARAKSLIARFQTPDDLLVIHKKDPTIHRVVRNSASKKIGFQAPSGRNNEGNTRLLGAHNAANIEAAKTVARLLRIPETAIRKAIRTFPGNPGRIEPIRRLNNVVYYNDTTATMPDATVAAIHALGATTHGSIILIAGGTDKKLDFRELGMLIKKKVKTLILLPGSATEKLRKDLTREKYSFARAVKNMNDAVFSAFSAARPGDVVLLSPGAASFGLFQNEFDRGARFNNAVRELPSYAGQ